MITTIKNTIVITTACTIIIIMTRHIAISVGQITHSIWDIIITVRMDMVTVITTLMGTTIITLDLITITATILTIMVATTTTHTILGMEMGYIITTLVITTPGTTITTSTIVMMFPQLHTITDTEAEAIMAQEVTIIQPTLTP